MTNKRFLYDEHKNPYDYVLTQDVCVDTCKWAGTKLDSVGYVAPPPLRVVSNQKVFVELSAEGMLQIFKGYAWDGVTMWPDTHRTMFPSLVHDALYQLMRENSISKNNDDDDKERKEFRKKADDIFYYIHEANGGWFCWGYWKIMRTFGKKYTRYKTIPKKKKKAKAKRKNKGTWIKSWSSPAEGSISCPEGKGGVKKKTTPKRKKALKSQKKSHGS